ncbi:MAG: S4 domain-containing protein, partial [Firmicutes bacterium]|nr:S4 domain-containing protein [Bacillota bacterium]
NRVGGVAYRAYGGYRGAVRKRLLVMPPHYLDEEADPGISFFGVRPGASGPAEDGSPDEALGFLRSLGIGRDQIGDVFSSPDGWQGVVAREVFPAGGSRGPLVELDAEEVTFPGQVTREIRTTVASMRLDAVAGGGFAASRTRLAQEIRVGRVKVNGVPVQSPSHKISEGDVIIASGRGRLVVCEVRGETRPRLVSLVLKRYSVHPNNIREEASNADTT